jgi:vacuolar-type H+-ATPase subunit I/STV1
MSKTIDKIRGLLNLPNLTKFYAEARLDDGRLVVTEAESMAVGVEISVMSDEGNADYLDDGTYALEDGTVLVVADGRITQLGEDEPEAEVEVEVEMAEGDEADVQDWAGMEKRIQNLEDAVADLKRDKDGGDDEVSEDLSELSSEINAAFENIVERLSAIENEPADTGVNHTPSNNKNQDMNQETFSSLKTADRAHAIISNFAKN